jgi:hypothetical protein
MALLWPPGRNKEVDLTYPSPVVFGEKISVSQPPVHGCQPPQPQIGSRVNGSERLKLATVDMGQVQSPASAGSVDINIPATTMRYNHICQHLHKCSLLAWQVEAYGDIPADCALCLLQCHVNRFAGGIKNWRDHEKMIFNSNLWYNETSRK